MSSNFIKDMVWSEYMLEHDLTVDEMLQEQHVNAMIKRVEHIEWQDEQRTAWMCGNKPQYQVPDDCPF